MTTIRIFYSPILVNRMKPKLPLNKEMSFLWLRVSSVGQFLSCMLTDVNRTLTYNYESIYAILFITSNSDQKLCGHLWTRTGHYSHKAFSIQQVERFLKIALEMWVREGHVIKLGRRLEVSWDKFCLKRSWKLHIIEWQYFFTSVEMCAKVQIFIKELESEPKRGENV